MREITVFPFYLCISHLHDLLAHRQFDRIFVGESLFATDRIV